MTDLNSTSHSAAYFDELRDYWWNTDFLELIATRFNLSSFREVLDIGSGQGHWTRIIKGLVHQNAHLTGLEMEQEWVAHCRNQFDESAFSFVQGTAENIPYKDESFDLVTCQTVLIHVKAIPQVLSEMYRVLKPGGLLLLSEPSNIASSTVRTSISAERSIEERVKYHEARLIIEEGKRLAGEGDLSAGDLLPGLLQHHPFDDIQVYNSDICKPDIPPYDSSQQQAWIKTLRTWVKEDFAGWHDEELKRWVLKAGYDEDKFCSIKSILMNELSSQLRGIEDGTFHSASGSMAYVIGARKIS